MHFAVFGTPGDESGWGWTIGGHPLSLHFTVRQGRISPPPAFFGAEPARASLPGQQVLRLLAAEEDRARDLLQRLDPDRRAVAVYVGTITVSSVFLAAAAVLVWRRPALRRTGITERGAFPRAAFLTTGVLVLALILGTAFPAVNYYGLLLLLLTGPALFGGWRLARRRRQA